VACHRPMKPSKWRDSRSNLSRRRSPPSARRRCTTRRLQPRREHDADRPRTMTSSCHTSRASVTIVSTASRRARETRSDVLPARSFYSREDDDEDRGVISASRRRVVRCRPTKLREQATSATSELRSETRDQRIDRPASP